MGTSVTLDPLTPRSLPSYDTTRSLRLQGCHFTRLTLVPWVDAAHTTTHEPETMWRSVLSRCGCSLSRIGAQAKSGPPAGRLRASAIPERAAWALVRLAGTPGEGSPRFFLWHRMGRRGVRSATDTEDTYRTAKAPTTLVGTPSPELLDRRHDLRTRFGAFDTEPLCVTGRAPPA